MAPSCGAGHASFDATFRWTLAMNSVEFTQNNVELAVTVYPGMFTDTNCWRIQSMKPQRSLHLLLRKHGPASSDDEMLIIDPNILDVVAGLPPENQWTEHLVEYPVIAFIDAANVNRLLNNTVM